MNFDFSKLVPKMDETDKESLAGILEKFKQESGVSDLLNSLGASSEKEEGMPSNVMGEDNGEPVDTNEEEKPCGCGSDETCPECENETPTKKPIRKDQMKGKNLKHILTIAIANKADKGE